MIVRRVKSESVRTCTGKALKYLNRVHSDSGWSDFRTHKSGEGKDWITAYVLASSVADLKYSWRWKDAANIVRDKLIDNENLGYNKHVPPDADSTALSLLAASTCNIHLPKQTLLGIEEFLLDHVVHGSGRYGLATYSCKSGILKYKDLDYQDAKGWCSTPALGVSAVGALVAEEFQELSHLRKELRHWFSAIPKKDHLNTYWWVSNWYVYPYLLKLAITHKQEGRLIEASNFVASYVRRDWAMFSLDNIESPIVAGLYVEVSNILYRMGYLTKRDFDSNVIPVVKWLVDVQDDEGYWAPYHILRIPYPWDKYPWASGYFDKSKGGTAGLHNDIKKVFSTVSITRALSDYVRVPNAATDIHPRVEGK